MHSYLETLVVPDSEGEEEPLQIWQNPRYSSSRSQVTEILSRNQSDGNNTFSQHVTNDSKWIDPYALLGIPTASKLSTNDHRDDEATGIYVTGPNDYHALSMNTSLRENQGTRSFIPSSPLAARSDSPTLCPPSDSPSARHGSNPAVQLAQDAAETPIDLNASSNFDQPQGNSDEVISGRHFRVRKPEQKKPYTFDQMRHRAEFLKYGLKPVRIPLLAQVALNEEEDSQFMPPSSPVEAPAFTRNSLPTALTGQATYTAKRLKLDRIKTNSSKAQYGLPSNGNPSRRIIALSDESDQGDITWQSQLSADKAGLDGPLNAGRGPVPRNVSVLPHDSPAVTVYVSSTDSSPRSHSMVGNRNSSSSSELSDDDLRTFKRKLHGVLPPSYLTLNASKKTNPTRVRDMTHEESQQFRKGLAKTKTRTIRVGSGAQDSSESDSSNTPSSSNGDNLHIHRKEIEQGRDPFGLNDIDSDEMEHDEIDRMWSRSRRVLKKLPEEQNSRRRINRNTKDRSKARQPRIGLQRRKATSGHFKKNNGTSKGQKKSHIEQGGVLKLGLLDALHHERCTNPAVTLPRFIRISRNRVQKRADYGRQTPIGKYFAFEDEESTEQAREKILRWKIGLTSLRKVSDDRLSYPKKKPGKEPGPERNAWTERGIATTSNPRRNKANAMTELPTMHQTTLQRERDRGVTLAAGGALKIVKPDRDRRMEAPHRYFTAQVEGIGDIKRRYTGTRPQKMSLENQLQFLKSMAIQPTGRNKIKPGTTEARTVNEENLKHLPKVQISSRTSERKAKPVQRITEKRNLALSFARDPRLDASTSSRDWVNDAYLSIHYDIKPLLRDCFFHYSSFLGSKGLHSALRSALGCETPRETPLCFNFTGARITWTAFNRDLAHQLNDCFEKVLENPDSNLRKEEIYTFFHFISNALTLSLGYETNEALFDLGILISRFAEKINDRSQWPYEDDCCKVYSFMFCCVYMVQLYRFSKTSELQTCLKKAFAITSFRLLSYLVDAGFAQFKVCVHSQQSPSQRSEGISAQFHHLEAWVVLRFLLDETGNGSLENSLKDLMGDALSKGINEYHTLEKFWSVCINLGLVSQFNIRGSVEFQTSIFADWTFVSHLLRRSFAICAELEPFHSNRLVRAVTGRIHNLVYDWQWHNAKPVIIQLYDYFSQQKLSDMAVDNGTEYPSFIRSRNERILLDVGVSDTSFHIFLKIVALVLSKMADSPLLQKDMRTLVSRITPCHSRHFPREKALSLKDLVSLQNHHSLLLTLIWAVPKPLRPPIDILKTLVTLQDSHARARLVAVEAWSLLYEILAGCGERCDESMEWIREIICLTVEEYCAVQRHFQRSNDRVASFEGRWNLKQLDNVLLVAIKSIHAKQLKCKLTFRNRVALLDKEICRVVFNSTAFLSKDVILETIDVVEDFISVYVERPTTGADLVTRMAESDSQDYADNAMLSALVESALEETQLEVTQSLSTEICASFITLISSALDPEFKNSNDILRKALRVWARMAYLSVQYGGKSWGHYLDYGGVWSRVGVSELKLSWSSVLFAEILELDPSVLSTHLHTVLTQWFACIVLPGADRLAPLTSHLLNNPIICEVFENPPFERDASDRYVITRSLLFHRREQFLSSRKTEIESRRALYIDCLDAVLSTMQKSFLAMRHGNGKHDHSFSSYTELCRRVSANLLQYCDEFRIPLLQWFIGEDDSSPFPFSAGDDLLYASRIQSYCRKGLSQRYVQVGLFQMLRARLHQCVFKNNVEQDFILQVVTAITPDLSATIADQQVNQLREFVICQLFGSYMNSGICDQPMLLYVSVMVATSRASYDALINHLRPSSAFSVECMNDLMSFVNSLEKMLLQWETTVSLGRLMSTSSGIMDRFMKEVYDFYSTTVHLFDWFSPNISMECKNCFERVIHHRIANSLEPFVEISEASDEVLDPSMDCVLPRLANAPSWLVQDIRTKFDEEWRQVEGTHGPVWEFCQGATRYTPKALVSGHGSRDDVCIAVTAFLTRAVQCGEVFEQACIDKLLRLHRVLQQGGFREETFEHFAKSTSKVRSLWGIVRNSQEFGDYEDESMIGV